MVHPGATPVSTPPIIGDLHTHTDRSDGILSTHELVVKAEQAKLTALAITDHDNMDAFRILRDEGYNGPLRIIPGIEISCYEGGREVHLLAYGLDPDVEEVQEYERFFRGDRERRGREMVDRLQASRVRISFDEVAETAGKAPIGRPHVADVLVRRGFVSSIQQAFDVYLDVGKPGYVSKSPFPVSEATQMVHRAGGITSVAHPGRHYADPHSFLTLVATGIDGIEVYHPSHWFVTREYYRVLCEQHNLVITGGSDFHGTREYDERNFGVFGVTADHLAAIDARIETIRSRRP
jgi:predicted metal-dependent phosphoesterase TrpH